MKYGTEYVRLVKEIADRADRVEAGETVEFPVRTFPLRIVKQALTILVASTSEPLTQEYPALIELILNRDATGLPEGLRLFCFIPVIRGVGKVTGRSVMISPEHSVPVRLAEASLWPLGWVITFAGVALAGAFEVTDWARKPFARREIVKGEV